MENDVENEHHIYIPLITDKRKFSDKHNCKKIDDKELNKVLFYKHINKKM